MENTREKGFALATNFWLTGEARFCSIKSSF